MLYIVGAGPGDPELITVKGLRLIEAADAIVYDRLVPRELLSRAKPGAKLIYVGKEPGSRVMEQHEINELLVSLGREMPVVRLHGGDPLVYGRGMEECIYALSRGVPCEIVPGVSSAIAAPARFMIPPVMRGVASSFAVITGMEDPAKGRRFVDVKRVASSVDTLIVLMGASRLGEIAREVAEVRGGDEPGAAIVHAYMLGERLVTFSAGSPPASVENPAVIVFGKVVEVGIRALELRRRLLNEG